ncbi:MAG: hypothetical protein LBI99_00885 [Propionibacteriaceae bacterium]|jgi:hypothetical protein|nr:hypothetical protein [Propionibacteriaceae bacterium]
MERQKNRMAVGTADAARAARSRAAALTIPDLPEGFAGLAGTLDRMKQGVDAALGVLASQGLTFAAKLDTALQAYDEMEQENEALIQARLRSL